MNNDVTVETISGVSKNNNQPWEALKLTIGDWSTLIFPKSKFELDYIKKTLNSKK